MPEGNEPLGDGLRALLDTAVRVPLADTDEPRVAVDVTPLERDPFLWSEAGADCEERDCPVALVELVRDRVDLGPRLERDDRLPLVPLPLRVADPRGWLPLSEPALVRPGERLPERPERVVTAAGRERCASPRSLVG